MTNSAMTYWEKVGYRTAMKDPKNWEKNLADLSNATRLKIEPEIVKKNMKGKILQGHVQELTEHLNAGGGSPSVVAVLANLVSSGFHGAASLGLFTTSFFLMLWALAPFRLAWHLACAAAATTSMAGAILFKMLLENLSQRFPKEDVQVWQIFLSAAGLVLLFSAIFNFANLRGLQLGVGGSSDAITGASKFYQSGGRYITAGFILIAFLSEIGSALCFFAAQSKFAASFPVFWMRRDLQKSNKAIQRLGTEITALRNEPELMLSEGAIGARRALADLGNIDPQKEAKTKLLRNLILFLLGLLFVLFLMGRAMGAETVVILKDLSVSSEERDYMGASAFELNKTAIEKYLSGIKPGLYLFIIGIHEESFAKPLVILRAQVNHDPGYFQEIITQERRRIQDDWRKSCLNLKPKSKASDYLGALKLAGEILKNSYDSRRSLVIFGDMLQATKQLNLETAKVMEGKFMNETIRQLHIPDFGGVTVRVYGAGGRDEEHFNGVKAFWQNFFKTAGGKIQTYSGLREVHHE